MKISEQLLKVMELFGPNGERWSNERLAETTSDGTTKYCLLGGLRKVAQGDAGVNSDYNLYNEPAGVRLLHRLVEQNGYHDIPAFNDANNSEEEEDCIEPSVDYQKRIKPLLCQALQTAIAEEETHED